MNPDSTRRKAGQIVRGVDANGDDRNVLVGADGSLVVGRPGSTTYESGTTVLTGLTCFAITFVTATVFTTLTGISGDSISGVSFPAGLTIYGPFTAITLASGSVLIYQ